MKLNSREGERWVARPDRNAAGTLLFGDDAMRVATKRQDLVHALLGPNGAEEMRLVRIPAADLRREKSTLNDEMRSQGFFPGPRAVLVEDATNQNADAILAALADWTPGDAHLVVTAGALKPASALRKGFETHPKAASIGIYDTPPDRAQIERMLNDTGLDASEPDARAHLLSLAERMEPGDFRQLVEKVAVYKHADPTPLSVAEIEQCAPASVEADVDDVIAVVADGRRTEIGPLLKRLQGRGVQPVTLCIGATRHFRVLHEVAADPGGPGEGIGRLRPPLYGPRRDAVLRQARDWGRDRLEQAIRLLLQTDLALRSSAKAPQMAVIERSLIRLALMAGR